MFNHKPSQVHKEVIDSLNSFLNDKNFENTNARISNSETSILVNSSLRCGIGNYDDQIKLINHYTCSCGNIMTTEQMSFNKFDSERVLNTHDLHCEKCGKDEKVSFISLIKFLKKSNNFKQPKRDIANPYL